MSCILVCISIVFITVTSAILYFKKKFSYWSDRNVPTLEPKFPMGNLNGVGTEIHFTHRIRDIYEKFKGKHLLAGFYFLHNPQVITIDLELIRSVLVKDFSNFHERGVYTNEKDDPLSGHLFNLDGPKWKNFRSKLSPTFTSGKMKMMYPTIRDCSKDIIVNITRTAHAKKPFDASDVCTRFTADVIGSCAFGFECRCLTTENTEFMTESKRCLDFSPPKRRLTVFIASALPKLSKYLGLRVFDMQTETFFRSIMSDTIGHRDRNNIERSDFLNLLLQIHRHGVVKGGAPGEKDVNVGKMTYDEILAQAFLFFAAGFETTSRTMMFALYEMALNQEVQDKARAEVKEVYEKHGNDLTYDGVMEMTYISQVFDGK